MDSKEKSNSQNQEKPENQGNDTSPTEESSFSEDFPLTAEGGSNGGMDSSGSSETLSKRVRTRTPSPSKEQAEGVEKPYMVPPSPPKYVSIDEILKTADGVTNMTLAHEIAVDTDFQLDRHNPLESSLEKRVREVMHQAFWDSLDAQMKETPPDYSQALQLLAEVKENLFEILLPHHEQMRNHINEVMDMELIEQKIGHGAFDFKYYAQFIISVMGRLCAPVRDERIEELQKITEIVPLFREIFDVLDLMKMDMANFSIQQIRPFIQQQSVEYERKKFNEFLKKEEEANMDGLLYTKQWLTRHADELQYTSGKPDGSAPRTPQPTPAQVLNKAYLEMLDWDDDNVFPETLLMDQGRFLVLTERTQRMTLVASILLVTYNTVGAPIVGIKGFKEKLKDLIYIILGDTISKNVKSCMLNVAEQIKKEVMECLAEHGFPALPEQRQKLLLGQIQDVASNEHPVHKIIKSRLMTFIMELITNPKPSEMKLPPGVSAIAEEISIVCGQFLKLISHNRAVFDQHYGGIITSLLKRTQLSEGATASAST